MQIWRRCVLACGCGWLADFTGMTHRGPWTRPPPPYGSSKHLLHTRTPYGWPRSFVVYNPILLTPDLYRLFKAKNICVYFTGVRSYANNTCICRPQDQTAPRRLFLGEATENRGRPTCESRKPDWMLSKGRVKSKAALHADSPRFTSNSPAFVSGCW